MKSGTKQSLQDCTKLFGDASLKNASEYLLWRHVYGRGNGMPGPYFHRPVIYPADLAAAENAGISSINSSPYSNAQRSQLENSCFDLRPAPTDVQLFLRRVYEPVDRDQDLGENLLSFKIYLVKRTKEMVSWTRFSRLEFYLK